MNPGKTLSNDLKVVLPFFANYSKSGRLVTKFQARNLMSLISVMSVLASPAVAFH